MPKADSNVFGFEDNGDEDEALNFNRQKDKDLKKQRKQFDDEKKRLDNEKKRLDDEKKRLDELDKKKRLDDEKRLNEQNLDGKRDFHDKQINLTDTESEEELVSSNDFEKAIAGLSDTFVTKEFAGKTYIDKQFAEQSINDMKQRLKAWEEAVDQRLETLEKAVGVGKPGKRPLDDEEKNKPEGKKRKLAEKEERVEQELEEAQELKEVQELEEEVLDFVEGPGDLLTNNVIKRMRKCKKGRSVNTPVIKLKRTMSGRWTCTWLVKGLWPTGTKLVQEGPTELNMVRDSKWKVRSMGTDAEEDN